MSTTVSSYNEKTVLEIETTGSIVEAATGVAVIVLAIVGLVRMDNAFLASVAGIVLGAALLAQGGAIAAEYSKLLSMITGGTAGTIELSSGMTSEMLAGGSIIVLGILGMLGLSAQILLPCGVIAVGAALILAAAGIQRLNTLKVQAAGLTGIVEKAVEGAVSGAVATQVLAGGAAIVLGILALTKPDQGVVLTLVGLLVLGAAVAVSGTALTGRLLHLFVKHG